MHFHSHFIAFNSKRKEGAVRKESSEQTQQLSARRTNKQKIKKKKTSQHNVHSMGKYNCRKFMCNMRKCFLEPSISWQNSLQHQICGDAVEQGKYACVFCISCQTKLMPMIIKWKYLYQPRRADGCQAPIYSYSIPSVLLYTKCNISQIFHWCNSIWVHRFRCWIMLFHRILEQTLRPAVLSVEIFKGRQNYASHSTSFVIRMNGELCVITVTIESPFNHGIGRYRMVAVYRISCSIVIFFLCIISLANVVARRTAWKDYL